MFIDEGFGTWDEDTLNQAMKALNSLPEGNRHAEGAGLIKRLLRKIELAVN